MDEESFREILEINRVEIVKRLQLDRTFLFDYLRSKAVFDGGDCELVQSEKTREQKAGKFLDLLVTKGENGYSHFIDAVQLLNPWLYERLTGEKSTARPNPILTEGRESFFLGRTDLADLDIMSNHLKRTISDLQDITLRYECVLKEKEQLEKRLSKASSDLEVEHRRVKDLERQKSETESLLFETHSCVKKAGEGAVQQVQMMSRELNERNNYIIALQMKLLSAQEEVENLKNKLNDTVQQNEALLDRFKEVSKNYDFQRRESMQLSVKLENQKDNIQKAEELKLKFRQVQFVNQKFKAEKEETLKELNDLKVWTEALKARYDIVEEDRRQTQESHETAVADCSSMRERTNELEIKLTICKREAEDLKNRCKDLQQAANTYREQRDLYEKAWKDASQEREQSRKEREEALQRLAEIVVGRDEDINRQIELGKQFEQQYEKAVQEIQVLREGLARTELELDEVKKTKIQRSPSEVSEQSAFSDKATYLNGIDSYLDTDKSMGTKVDGVDDQVDGSSTYSDGSYDWETRRKTTAIIDSLKKRVGMRRQPNAHSSLDGSEEGGSSPPPRCEKSLSLDEKLEKWVPEKKALSPATQESLSLDRPNRLFKTDLPYGALEKMFGGSVGSSCSSTVVSETQVQSDFQTDLLNLSLPNASFERPATVECEDGRKVGERRQLSLETAEPKRPPYRKSNSSPSNILNLLRYGQSESDICASEDKAIELKNAEGMEMPQTERYKTSSWPLTLENLQRLDTRTDDDSWEIAEALMSPSFQLPFRKRSAAMDGKRTCRVRSSSEPSSPLPSSVASKRLTDTHSQ